MRDLQQLYDDVIKELPFSITGHVNIDKMLYAFYDKLAASNFIRYNPNFTFLFSAVLGLRDEDEDHSNLLEWDVVSYKKFYFKVLKNVDKQATIIQPLPLLCLLQAIRCGITSFLIQPE